MTNELAVSHGTVEDRKNALVKNAKNIVGDADDLLKQVANSTAEEFAAARTKIETSLVDVRSRLHDARIASTVKVCRAADATQVFIRENPWKLIGIAAAAALAIGMLANRR